MADANFGLYHALGLTFNATDEQIKKSFRKLSLKSHPDRNPGDEAAKDRFQKINLAHTTLSDASKRAEYDAVFRMRCVLEQGVLTSQQLVVPLDSVYMFAVSQIGLLGMREESVLMVNLVDGIMSGRVERWRHGEAVDVRPLSSLRSVDDEYATARSPPTLKLTFGSPSDASGGKVTLMQISMRSPGDATTLSVLLRALLTTCSLSTSTPFVELRQSDEQMPPQPKLTAWLTFRPSANSSALAAAFSRPSRVFVMLGRSKLLVFADALCTNLKQLVTLEPGAVLLSHDEGTTDFELMLRSSASSGSNGGSGGSRASKPFKLVLTADTSFVADQWAAAIADCLMAARCIDDVDSQHGALLAQSSSGAHTSVRGSGDTGGESAAGELAAGKNPGSGLGLGTSSTATLASRHVRTPSGDLLGDLFSPGTTCDRPSSPLTELSEALLGTPHKAKSDMAPPFIDLLAPAPPLGSTTNQNTGTPQQPAASLQPPCLLGDELGSMQENQANAMAAPTGGRILPMKSDALQQVAQHQLTLFKPFQGSRLGLDIDSADGVGIVVCEVAPGSIAAAAGLQEGDRLLQVNGQEVRSTDDAAGLLSAAFGATLVLVQRTRFASRATSPYPDIADLDPIFSSETKTRPMPLNTGVGEPAAETTTITSSVDSTTFAMILQLKEIGLNHQQAEQALIESGMSSVAAAADWHFTHYASCEEARADVLLAGLVTQPSIPRDSQSPSQAPPPPANLLD